MLASSCREASTLKLYLAGPLFTPAERGFLDGLANELRGARFEVFVPHQESDRISELGPGPIFELDYGRGLRSADALVAWLDGPSVDDGTACEIGLFYGLMQQEPRRRGILGLATDLRLRRRGEAGLNLFVAGLLERAGGICWSVEELRGRLEAWRDESPGERRSE